MAKFGSSSEIQRRFANEIDKFVLIADGTELLQVARRPYEYSYVVC
jgi:hypothetical protein